MNRKMKIGVRSRMVPSTGTSVSMKLSVPPCRHVDVSPNLEAF